MHSGVVPYPASVNKKEKKKIIEDDKQEMVVIDKVSPDFIDKTAIFILDKYEKVFVLKAFGELMPKASYMQKRYILSHVKDYDSDEEIGIKRRLFLVTESLVKFINEGKKLLYYKGFATFRLRKYEEVIFELCERILEDRLKRQEYEDFISLLKYFVSTKKERPEKVDVYAKRGGGYEIFDEKGNDITKKSMEDFFSGDQEAMDISPSDLLISMLITIAPQKVIIHSKEKIENELLLETIDKVFCGNVIFC